MNVPTFPVEASLHRSCQEGNLAAIKEELARGAKIDGPDPNTGYVPLHWACYRGHLPVVKHLVEQKAALNPQNKWGWTPMMEAAWGGYASIVKFLLDAKADTS